jgi:hypothetical protein
MDTQNEVAMAHIKRLSQEINAAYQAMRDERHQLATWEETQEASILGEIELLTTHLQGYAGRFLASRDEESTESLAKIYAVKPFEITQISDWYMAYGEQYPQICRYIELLDYLRLLLVEYWKQRPHQVAA